MVALNPAAIRADAAFSPSAMMIGSEFLMTSGRLNNGLGSAMAFHFQPVAPDVDLHHVSGKTSLPAGVSNRAIYPRISLSLPKYSQTATGFLPLFISTNSFAGSGANGIATHVSDFDGAGAGVDPILPANHSAADFMSVSRASCTSLKIPPLSPVAKSDHIPVCVLIDIDDPGSPVMDPILNSLPDFLPAGNNSRQMDSMCGAAFWLSSLKSWFMLLF